MDFFEKFGGRQVFLRWDKTQGQPLYDKDFTIEELAKAIEDRILKRIPLALKQPPFECSHGEFSISGLGYKTRGDKHCRDCGDKLE